MFYEALARYALASMGSGPARSIVEESATADRCTGERAVLQCSQFVGSRIERGLGREDFKVDARLLRRGLLDNGYSELPVGSEHVVAIDSLPPIHKDPFDRILVAQAQVEGITLLTADSLVAQYPGPVRSI